MMNLLPDDGDTPLATLVTLLRSATRLVERLRGDDALVARLLDVFAQFPDDDRAPLLAILEREVAAPQVANGSAVLGLPSHVRLNPGARLYLRIYDGASNPVWPPAEVAAALARASRGLQTALAGPPESREALLRTIRDVYRSLPARERAAVELCCDVVVAARDEDAARDGVGGRDGGEPD